MTWQRLSPWVFPSLGRGPDDVLVTTADDPPPRDDFERLHPSLGYYLVNEWISAPEPRDQLAALWLELTGEDLVPSEAGARKLVALIEDERLYLWGPIRAGVTEPAVFPGHLGGKDRPQPELETTWIEIVLLDEQGAPVGGEEYRITLPDGAVRTGRLDERGFARLDGITHGVCDITFPRIDGREWGPSLPTSSAASATSHLHQAREDEDLFTIASLYGFRHWETVWNHPPNARLRSSRDPNLLYPEDEVAIPERHERVEEGATAARHRFVLRRASRWLRIVLLDYERKPLTNAPFALFRGRAIVAEDVTDQDGSFERPIPTNAVTLTLDCSIGAFELRVGALNPLDHVSDNGISGAQGRLNNLGYNAGAIDGVLGPATRAALLRFQHDHNIEPNGTLDVRTKTLLKAAHGC